MIKPVVLCVLDGWGYRADGKGNAIEEANTPCMDRLFKTYPHTLLQASEGYVGLPEGQMGNSEVGHTNIGAGRVILQDFPRINHEIQMDTLKNRAALLQFIGALKASNGTCHLMGLMSPGGVHSHQMHLEYLVQTLSQNGIPVEIHAFLDGRDTPPKSALGFVADLVKALPGAVIATISGRFYAMDRDNRWERVEKAYAAMVSAAAEQHYTNPLTVIENSYQQNITDEFVVPCVREGYSGMKDGDGILMFNFRADRAREILTALVDPEFKAFVRSKVVKFGAKLGMVSYSEKLDAFVDSLIKPERIANTLGEVIAKHGLTQLRIAETEKYAHVTFFFNGGEEKVSPGEDRILIASPKVATYDLQPEMSAYEVTDALVTALAAKKYDFIVVNYANTDMVGHTGDEQAAIKAVEAVDYCLQKLSEEVLRQGGALLITADHGNAELMIDEATGQPHTAHTLYPVPFLLVAQNMNAVELREGALSDVAPTVLELMQIDQPNEMTANSLIVHR